MNPEKIVIGNAELWHCDCREVPPFANQALNTIDPESLLAPVKQAA